MLTADQMNEFEETGFLRIPDFVPPTLLSELRNLFDGLMDVSNGTENKVIIEKNGKQYVTNLENICHAENLSCLELLGYPPLMEIARQICGEDFFLIQEFAVIKNRGDELPVLWHQDMVHERKGKCFTMGIYLDPVSAGDGALRVVPGSHLMDKSICELRHLPYTENPMEAGDILIHDMMLAHYSEPLHHNPVRRVIYFEFLSATHVAAEKIYIPELVQRRSRLHPLAIRYYRQLHPDEPVFGETIKESSANDMEKSIKEILSEIYALPVQARPSAYCLEHA